MTQAEIVEFVQTTVQERCDEGHKRLRADLTKAEAQIESNYKWFSERADMIRDLRSDLNALRIAPVNIDKLFFTPKVVGSIVLAVVAIYGAFQLTTSSLKSDMRDVLTRMTAQQTTDKARADLQDVQYAALKTTVDDMKRQLQLTQYEVQALKDLVNKKKGG